MTFEKRTLRLSILTQYDPPKVDRIQTQYPNLHVNVFTNDDHFLAGLPESDIVCLQKEISLGTSQKMGPLVLGSGRLRWVHWGYTGRGRIGKAVVERFQNWGADLLFYGPYVGLYQNRCSIN